MPIFLKPYANPSSTQLPNLLLPLLLTLPFPSVESRDSLEREDFFFQRIKKRQTLTFANKSCSNFSSHMSTELQDIQGVAPKQLIKDGDTKMYPRTEGERTWVVQSNSAIVSDKKREAQSGK